MGRHLYNMGRQIEIEWVPLKIKITADLLEDKNPEFCDLLWKYLPYRSTQIHALISGQHLYHYLPIMEVFFMNPKTKESRAKSADGTVFLSYLQHLSIKYGENTEDLPAAPVAQVILEDIPKLKEAGKKCWESTYKTKELIEVRVTKKGEKVSEKDFKIRKPNPVKNKEVQELINEIHTETEKIWIDPPKDIVDVHTGNIKTKAGSYGQYFSTMVFVNGEERSLGYNALGSLLKTCKTTDIDLELLKQITLNFVYIPAEFLGYAGLEKLWEFVQKMLNVLDLVETKDEYFSLISILAMYVNRLNGWNLHYFPWKYGENYKFKS